MPTPLAQALEALPPIPEDCQWANFVRNHDELTLDKLSEEERQEVFDVFGPEEDLQLYGRGHPPAAADDAGGDERRIRLVYSLAFSLPGTPVLFYGEEIGMAENLAIEGRYSVRAPMQWSAEPQAGFTTAGEAVRPVVDGGALRVSRGERHAPAAGSRVTAQLDGAPDPAAARVPGARLGGVTQLDSGDAAVFAQRSDWEGSTVVAVHNLAGREARARLELGGEGVLVDLFHDDDHELEEGVVALELPPHGAHWFRLRRPAGGSHHESEA